MKEQHILYILVFKKKRYIKIGLTENDRFINRLKEIERNFGSIDKERSLYYYSISAKAIKQTEKGLHALFWDHSKVYEKGSGKTEFFKENLFRNINKFLIQNKNTLNLTGPNYFKEQSNRFNTISIILTILFIFIFIFSFSFSSIHYFP